MIQSISILINQLKEKQELIQRQNNLAVDIISSLIYVTYQLRVIQDQNHLFDKTYTQMDTNIKISIGMQDNAGAQQNNYTRINFDFEIQTQRIEAISKQLKQKTGKFRVPTLIFDFPSSAKSMNLPIFESQPGQVQYECIQKNDRVYKCLNVISGEFTSTKKKIQKIFSKITDLDNKLYLHLDLYNVDGYEQKLKAKKDYAIVVFLQKARIQGRFNLDPKFWDVLAQLIKKVSPKFAQSPLMAALPLFGGIDCQIQLDSLNQLQLPNQEQLFNIKSYQDPGDDEQGQKIKKQFKNKDKVYIYLSFGDMGVLRIQLQVRMFAIYNCLG